MLHIRKLRSQLERQIVRKPAVRIELTHLRYKGRRLPLHQAGVQLTGVRTGIEPYPQGSQTCMLPLQYSHHNVAASRDSECTLWESNPILANAPVHYKARFFTLTQLPSSKIRSECQCHPLRSLILHSIHGPLTPAGSVSIRAILSERARLISLL